MTPLRPVLHLSPNHQILGQYSEVIQSQASTTGGVAYDIDREVGAVPLPRMNQKRKVPPVYLFILTINIAFAI